VNRTIKLRLLVRPPVPVSTAVHQDARGAGWTIARLYVAAEALASAAV